MKHVYLLESQAVPKQFHIGITANPDLRLRKHNEGGATHTARFRPWKLVASIRFEKEVRAREFERYLKSPSGRAFTAKHFR